MAIRGMNHAVLYVRDADRTAAFYRDILGFREVTRMSMGGGGTGIFMQAPDSTNDHDIAFFGLGEKLRSSTAGRDQVGLYHLAWEVATLGDLADYARKLSEVGALVGATDHGTTKALYAKDPDGLEFEVSWIVPVRLLADADAERVRFAPLDIDAELARFGANTPGGAMAS
jgi:catechol-2,3-dioxygenase